MPSERDKRIAREGDEAARTALAGRADAAPELLYFLAGDTTPGVRAAVAGNQGAPAQADGLLAADQDPAVRAAVGRKLAPRAPALAATQDRLGALGWRTLCALAEDTATRVRAVIAEELKSMPDAPRCLVLRLAQDAAMEVAEPIICVSPLLTEDDLLALTTAPSVPATVTAVARRPGLTERISDAVVGTARPEAIAALLGNATAAIREATLDTLIAGAASQLPWQEALVARPALPARALRALTRCVADHLLQPLADRPDLDPGLAAALRHRVAARLAEGPAPACPLADAAARGDAAAMVRLLAERAGVAPAVVETAARLRSAKGLVSLCWQGGIGMATAALVQAVVGRLPPEATLKPAEDGTWPLSAEEMRWQIELLMEPVRA